MRFLNLTQPSGNHVLLNPRNIAFVEVDTLADEQIVLDITLNNRSGSLHCVPVDQGGHPLSPQDIKLRVIEWGKNVLLEHLDDYISSRG
ncbi:MAG: hypothetical protein L0K07_10075 [Yaniella sp.]|uniref:Uncharacterized protein n=2 Tax=Brevibacterium TaxID=1696 RepID=A0A2A3YPK8_BREAU|nr:MULTISPECIES: hypothetical protein [Brevibacterium]MDN5546870.1 hypothetical protein [Rhodococcus sp. (in: high G+C Gram-positive bacteria)]MDN6411703.1 hypothetical protein [Yaniella sp.]AZT92763.1 hypothetical protein CXR23_06105 [Brevibacterium aurantiacum]AZT96593.1 hypothetical protein CXR27_05930 [Brevibacterium aurantiacum]PCC19240.1 hypothetical protein CIK79_13665 [Brevibacterium aurantiacum]